MARETEFGEVVRFVQAPEPAGMVFVIGALTLTELAFVGVFLYELADAPNTIAKQQFLAFVLGSALLNLAAILAVYRRWFLPDVMIVKKRKQKYEDLM
jgi:hypothetical protein